ncbi:MAG TPA: hypothetical protein VKZ18_22955 [Polyangia bacterium]|nr:hypothetical protein [Polyangia bacterium]
MLTTTVNEAELLGDMRQSGDPSDLAATRNVSVRPPTVVARRHELASTLAVVVPQKEHEGLWRCLVLSVALFGVFDVATMAALGAGPVCLAGAFCLLAGALGGLYSSARRQLDGVEDVPFSPIGAWGEGPARLRGLVVPGEEGLLVSPRSSAAAVWIRLATKIPRGRGSARLVETLSRNFFIEDESGARVRIVPQGADVIARETKLRCAECSPSIAAYLSSRSMALNGRETVNQSLLRPGDVVSVVGDVRLRSGELLVERPSIIAKETLLADWARTSRWLWRLTVTSLVIGWTLLAWSIAG